MKHFGVNRAILVGNFKQSKCCSEGSQLIRSEISIKLAKVSKICQNTPLLPVSLRLCPNSYLLRHFDLPLPDHDDTTAIASSRFHNRAKNPPLALNRRNKCGNSYILPLIASNRCIFSFTR